MPAALPVPAPALPLPAAQPDADATLPLHCPAALQEVRGLGLICGIQLDQMAGPLTTAARDRGVIVITAGKGDIVRLVPPLVVT